MIIDAKAKKEILKDIIKDLHAGGDVESLRKRLAELVHDVSGGEIAAMEQELISEGLAEEEVKKLCDVHVQVFKDPLEEKPAPGTAPAAAPAAGPARTAAEAGIALDTGVLTAGQVNLLLTHLPLDVSFVDENDTVVYYSATPERIFPRTPGVIGRKVQNCHPPKSLDVVNRILKDFREGTRDTAEFWIQSRGMFIHIRYFAMRDGGGTYRGCLEVSQEVTGIRALQGERRLLDGLPAEPDV